MSVSSVERERSFLTHYQLDRMETVPAKFSDNIWSRQLGKESLVCLHTWQIGHVPDGSLSLKPVLDEYQMMRNSPLELITLVDYGL